MKRRWSPRTSNRTTKGSLGSAVKRTRRCISTNNGSKSRSSFAGSRASQRCPHVPSVLTSIASSCPALVSSYSGPWGPSVRTIAPTKTRAWSRSERTVRDTRGMPLRISLKRRLPQRISRTIKRVHRPPNTSWARAMEQYCPYPVMPGNLSRRANRCGTESGPRLCPSTALAEFKRGAVKDDPMSALGHQQTNAAKRHVRFTPESGHVQCNGPCPLRAKSRHPAPLFWLGEMLLQPRDLLPGPATNIRHLDPCVNVVRRGVDVAVANRRCGCHELVRCQLKKSYDRVPPQSWRHVRATWRQHPVGFAIETAVLEEGHRVACILEIDDPHRPPCGIRSRSRAIALSVLVHEPHERSVAERSVDVRIGSYADISHCSILSPQLFANC